MKKVTDFVVRQSRRKLVIGSLAAVLIVGSVSAYALHHGKAQAKTATRAPKGEQVTVASVSSLSSNSAPLSVIGKVESENQATILSETSGEIVALNVGIGDQVSAGDVIATFENSSQQAAVVQAQGSYDAAEATLEKASGATAQNSSISSTQAEDTVQNDQTSAIAALQSTYAALDDAVHTKADVLFTNPRSAMPTINGLLVPNSQLLQTTENERGQLEPVLNDANTLMSDTAAADIDSNVTAMIGDAETVETFLNDLVSTIDDAVPNQTVSEAQINNYQTSIAAARTEVVNAVTSLTTAKSNYDTAVTNASTATNTASAGSDSDIDVAKADVESQEGALDAAKAALEKTIVRSPISGTIVDLPVTTGDYVTTSSEIADVSNPSALKIVAYVTADDSQTLAVGNKAVINDTAQGVITQISPAIDPSTGTIEVDIGITGDQAGLVDGDSVTVDLDRTVSAVAPTTGSNDSIIIPIVSLKITPTGPVVFTVDPATKTLVSHAVSIGSILGENIVVTQGLTPDMVIVTDARGLTDGENVSVKTS